MMDRTKMHENFKQRYYRSEPYVMLAAIILVSRGHTVTMPTQPVAQDVNNRGWYQDAGDLLSDGKLVEVKHCTTRFTSATDWPFGKEFMIGSQSLIDKEPWVFMCFSWTGDYYGVITKSSRERWYTKDSFDGEREHKQARWMCALSDVTFMHVNDGLVNRVRAVIDTGPKDKSYKDWWAEFEIKQGVRYE